MSTEDNLRDLVREVLDPSTRWVQDAALDAMRKSGLNLDPPRLEYREESVLAVQHKSGCLYAITVPDQMRGREGRPCRGCGESLDLVSHRRQVLAGGVLVSDEVETAEDIASKREAKRAAAAVEGRRRDRERLAAAEAATS